VAALGSELGREIEVRARPGQHQEQFEVTALDQGPAVPLALPWLVGRAAAGTAAAAAGERPFDEAEAGAEDEREEPAELDDFAEDPEKGEEGISRTCHGYTADVGAGNGSSPGGEEPGEGADALDEAERNPILPRPGEGEGS
jgi:hypothetical protein